MQDIELLKKQILNVCRELDRRKFVANHDGNVSVRLSRNRFLVTPSAFAKRDIEAADLLIVDLDGKVLEGRHKVFSEWKFHRAVFESFEDVTSIVHAHPTSAMGWGLTGKQLGYPGVPEALVSLGGPLMTTNLVTSLSSQREIHSEMKAALQNCYACLVPGNGVFAVGDDPVMAHLRVELVEQIIRSQMAALQIGQAKTLDRGLVQELIEKRPVLKPQWNKIIENKKSDEDSTPNQKHGRTNMAAVTPDVVREIIRKEILKHLGQNGY